MRSLLVHRLRREAAGVTQSDDAEANEDEFYDSTETYEDDQTTAAAENLIEKMTEQVAQKMHSSYIVSWPETDARARRTKWKPTTIFTNGAVLSGPQN
jgi:hypothetical protein